MLSEEQKILLSAYHDNALSNEEKAQAETLLAQDPQSRAYLAELQKLSSVLPCIKNQALSPDAQIKIRKNIHKESSMQSTQLKYPAMVLATVVICALVFTSTYLKRGVQGRLKSSTDDIGVQSVSGFGGSALQSRLKDASQYIATTETTATLSKTAQYEPYYQQTNYDVRREASDRKVIVGYAAADGADHSIKEKGIAYNVPAAALKSVSTPASSPVRAAVVNQYYPLELANTEEYKTINDNQFLTALDNPLSTFSIDVDTASYSNMRRFLLNNQMPPVDAVRIEEMVNYFNYDYPVPKNNEPFSITTNMAVCPWNDQHQLLHIGLKGRTPDAANLPPSNLVFLIDVSGSMNDSDKLPLLKDSFKMMVDQLRPADKVSIVVYAGSSGVVLYPTTGDNKAAIIGAIDRMQAGGSTAGGAGMEMAYKLAKEQFIPGGNNRVIWATDGDFNVGTSNTSDLVRSVEEKRKDGIYLTVLGFGQGNYKDGRMQEIADKGNGNYYYIDNLKEARKVLVNELGSVLFAIAKDVKIQIEFNPGAVKSYRLIGYEKRLLAKEDFNNDKKDAGEIGAGHTVTALYEIVPAGVQEESNSVDPLKYQKAKPININDEVMTVKLRYKQPSEETSKLITRTIKKSQITNEPRGDFAWASSVAEFGMLLRNSEFKGSSSYDHVVRSARANVGADKFGLRSEFIMMVENADRIAPQARGQMQFK